MKETQMQFGQLELPNKIKRCLKRMGVKTAEELGNLPIEVIYNICDKKIKLLIEVLEKLEAVFSE